MDTKIPYILKKYFSNKNFLASLLIIIVLILWIFYVFDLLNYKIIEDYLKDSPIQAIFIFIFIYTFFVFAAIPSLPLNLAAGFYWGTLLGGLYTAVAVTIGSWFSFMFARKFIGQPFSRPFESSWMNLIQRNFDNNSWKFVALVRINPLIPTGPINILLGLTSITISKFLISTFFFLLPVCIFISYIGESIHLITDQKKILMENFKYLIIISVSLIAILIVFLFILNRIKKVR